MAATFPTYTSSNFDRIEFRYRQFVRRKSAPPSRPLSSPDIIVHLINMEYASVFNYHVGFASVAR